MLWFDLKPHANFNVYILMHSPCQTPSRGDCEENLSPLIEPWNKCVIVKTFYSKARGRRLTGLTDRLPYLSWRSALMSTYTVVGSGPEVPCSQSQNKWSERFSFPNSPTAFHWSDELTVQWVNNLNGREAAKKILFLVKEAKKKWS